MRIAILSVQYGIETSPTIKSVVSYLVAEGQKVDIFVDHLRVDPGITIAGASICTLGVPYADDLSVAIVKLRPSRVFARLSKWIKRWDQIVVRSRLYYALKGYDKVFCVEAHSLAALGAIEFDLQKCVYLSLESVERLKLYDLQYIRDLLSRVTLCVIQSPERQADFMKYIELPLSWAYLPVALRPRTCPDKSLHYRNNNGHTVKIIFSGYLDSWSCMKEFLLAYAEVKDGPPTKLCIQGNKKRKESYFYGLQQVVFDNNLASRVEMDGSYYPDDIHHTLLCCFDIGLALYRTPHFTDALNPNWHNLIFSSGKIATYLWAGLAIITNIAVPLTARPPFIFVPEITPEAITDALQVYLEQPAHFREAAKELAYTHYNLDMYMKKILGNIT